MVGLPFRHKNIHIMPFILIYNASSSIRGELSFLMQKMTCSIMNKDSPCAACDITHSFKELGMKQSFKLLLERYQIQTLHTNELPSSLLKFTCDLNLPVLLMEDSTDGSYRVVAVREQLLQCQGSVEEFEKLLIE